MQIRFQRVSYGGWRNCYKIFNKSVDIIVTADVGPRVIRFGFKGEPNEFWENTPVVGKKGGKAWVNFGGHRLWHSPESIPRTYYPDNFPVKVENHKTFLRFIQPVEKTTGIIKEMDFAFSSPVTTKIKVTHRLRNVGQWPVEFAIWALSVMAPGGMAVIPLPPRGPHSDPRNLQPKNLMSMWSYTNLRDPRWTWGERYILLQQSNNEKPQKVGVLDNEGWVGYCNHGNLFVKTYKVLKGVSYPDYNSNVETFTNDQMLEVETLSPLSVVKPDGSIEHVEFWYLFENVVKPRNDEDVERYILPKVKPLL